MRRQLRHAVTEGPRPHSAIGANRPTPGPGRGLRTTIAGRRSTILRWRVSRRDRTARDTNGIRVLRVSKSGVVTAWRERERQLRTPGADLTLVAAQGGRRAARWCSSPADGDTFVVPVRTVGRHPNLFLYDPRPLWRLLGSRTGTWSTCTRSRSVGRRRVHAPALAAAPGVPFIFSSAQNIEKRYPPPFRWLEHAALRRAAGAYTCNSEAGRILRRKGLQASGSSCPSVWTSTGSGRADREPRPGSLRVGFVGRLIRHKGVDVLLDAVALDDRLAPTSSVPAPSRPG